MSAIEIFLAVTVMVEAFLILWLIDTIDELRIDNAKLRIDLLHK